MNIYRSGLSSVLEPMPRTDRQKIKKPVLLHEFFERNPQRDCDENDFLYAVTGGTLKEFTTRDFRHEMNKCTDPLVRSRFAAVTRRQDLFNEQSNN